MRLAGGAARRGPSRSPASASSPKGRTTATPTEPGSPRPATTGSSRARLLLQVPHRRGRAAARRQMCRRWRAGSTAKRQRIGAARHPPSPRPRRRAKSRNQGRGDCCRLALSGFLVLLALGAVGHALATAVTPAPRRTGGPAGTGDDPAAGADGGPHPGERTGPDRARIRDAAGLRPWPQPLARCRREHAAGLSPAARRVGIAADRPRPSCWPRTSSPPGQDTTPHVYAAGRYSAPNDLVPARARGLPEILTVIEQHKPEAQITDIRIPPTGRDEGIQAAAGCHLAVDTMPSTCWAPRTRWPMTTRPPPPTRNGPWTFSATWGTSSARAQPLKPWVARSCRPADTPGRRHQLPAGPPATPGGRCGAGEGAALGGLGRVRSG